MINELISRLFKPSRSSGWALFKFHSCFAVSWRQSRLVQLMVCLLAASMPMGCTYLQHPPEIQPPFPLRNLPPIERKIEAPLARYITRAHEDDPIPVVLILKRQVSLEDKSRLFSQIKTKDRVERKRQKRQLLVTELKRVARNTQTGVVAFLRSLEKIGEVRNVKPLWISNVIGVKAPKRVIARLTHFKEIDRIHLDLPQPIAGEITWGVQKINADDVWNLSPTGYDGSGVVVAVVDSGIDYTHGDLAGNIWMNPIDTAVDGSDDDGNGYVDDIRGWNFENDNNNPDDDTGHGTHMAGIIAGNGSGGSDTGVAPGALLMALRITAYPSLSGLGSAEIKVWDAFQYVLQYAAATGADIIINFSAGWVNCYFPDPMGVCAATPSFATWRTEVEHLMDAEVLFVTSAGNDNNTTVGTVPPYQIRTPGNVPLALTVGATRNTLTNDIWTNSSLGPVTWQDVVGFNDYPWRDNTGPGLLKPDVSAPGVLIKTTEDGGGYVATGSGTSLAAPHAAGVAALLLEKDPGLTAYELKYLIEETATDLGGMSPNDTYGWGLVNVEAAITEATILTTIDDTPYDVSITGTSALWTTVDIWIDNDNDGIPDTPHFGPGNHLYARVRNLSGQVVSNVELKFYFADVATTGIGGFDPEGDGGDFEYIGSYRVPILGPSSSYHKEAEALVNWDIPPLAVGQNHWCVAVAIVAPTSSNLPEIDTSNNRAFRNFFNITTSTGSIDFKIVPPPKAPDQPFGFEIQTMNLPEGTTVDLLVHKALEEQLIVKPEGLFKIKDRMVNFNRDRDSEYNQALQKSMPFGRYRLIGTRAVLREIVSKQGTPIPAKIIVNVPDDAPVEAERLVVLSTLDRQGKRVGGLTLNLVKGTPHQRGGPYLPKIVK